MSAPSTSTWPVVGVTMPQTMLISVVLPAPLGPSRAKISPFWISRLVLCRACTPEAYDLVTFWIERMGAMRADHSRSRLWRPSPFGAPVVRLPEKRQDGVFLGQPEHGLAHLHALAFAHAVRELHAFRREHDDGRAVLEPAHFLALAEVCIAGDDVGAAV